MSGNNHDRRYGFLMGGLIVLLFGVMGFILIDSLWRTPLSYTVGNTTVYVFNARGTVNHNSLQTSDSYVYGEDKANDCIDVEMRDRFCTVDTWPVTVFIHDKKDTLERLEIERSEINLLLFDAHAGIIQQ